MTSNEMRLVSALDGFTDMQLLAELERRREARRGDPVRLGGRLWRIEDEPQDRRAQAPAALEDADGL
jgi:hypothetical protein